MSRARDRTYPSRPMNGPNTGLTAGELPPNYCAAIRAILAPARPIAFAELGHPATASSLFASGSEQEQTEFIQKWVTIVPPNTTFAVWTHLYNPDLRSVYGSEVAEYFVSTGLLQRNATASGPSE